jgi:hypothetical protein
MSKENVHQVRSKEVLHQVRSELMTTAIRLASVPLREASYTGRICAGVSLAMWEATQGRPETLIALEQAVRGLSDAKELDKLRPGRPDIHGARQYTESLAKLGVKLARIDQQPVSVQDFVRAALAIKGVSR